MAGGATLPRLLESSELEHLEIPFCFNWGEEVAVASVAGYAKLAFVVFSWFSLLVLLGLSPSFSSSTGTGTIEDDDLVDLGAVQMLLISYIIGGSSIRVLSPHLPPTNFRMMRSSSRRRRRIRSASGGMRSALKSSFSRGGYCRWGIFSPCRSNGWWLGLGVGCELSILM